MEKSIDDRDREGPCHPLGPGRGHGGAAWNGPSALAGVSERPAYDTLNQAILTGKAIKAIKAFGEQYADAISMQANLDAP